uniref:Uncharacterized protein n=1 Tax=uncultured bacterium BLR5 TaxID=506522 RepID=C0INX1_9BACT|nr:hypothetical protein AKSOIL_0047 [uncultured bacterium BLR5]
MRGEHLRMFWGVITRWPAASKLLTVNPCRLVYFILRGRIKAVFTPDTVSHGNALLIKTIPSTGQLEVAN